jgi:hypothetical protein
VALTANDVVNASLAALERDEVVCVPSVANPTLFDGLNEAQIKVFRASAMQSIPAERYR